MSTITAKTSKKGVVRAKSIKATPVEPEADVIVQKTYRMAETLKKYPLPGK